MASGLGLPQILRWIWWRANAWTELSGMLTALCLSLVLYPVFPDVRSEYLLFWTAIGSVLVSITVTFLTPPIGKDTLNAFVIRTQPFGFWGKWGGTEVRKEFYSRCWIWILASISLYASLFGTGTLLKKELVHAAIYLGLSFISGISAYRLWMNKTKLQTVRIQDIKTVQNKLIS